MRMMCRGLSVLLVACFLVGCSGESGESGATPDKPADGLEALKKMQTPLSPKDAAKGPAHEKK